MSTRRNAILCLVILGIPILLGFVSTAIHGWHYVFDDAFITYRYAKNLAMGHGITWNPGYPPTEGYTNFLLVVFLAPFIRLGLSPLAVTRIVSYLSTVAMVGVIFQSAKVRRNSSVPAAMLIAAVILLTPQTRNLCLVGLETVAYALLLLIVFHKGVDFLKTQQTRNSVQFSVLLFLAMLLRPEALLIVPVLCLVYCSHLGGEPLHLRPLGVGGLVLLGLAAPYLAWKALHFGSLLPNPFYIKLASISDFNRHGLMSVSSFFFTHAILVAATFASLWLSRSRDADRRSESRLASVFALGFVSLYAFFFIQVDTLMDINGRFMYPLVPILVYASTPAFLAGFTALESWLRAPTLTTSGIAVVFLLAFDSHDVLGAYHNLKLLTPDDTWKTSNALMQKELRAAESLAAFPGIESVHIGFGDSGVIPYFTGALWLDTVGLNDTFLARAKSKRQAVDYFFRCQPDLVISPGDNRRYTWITYGHGRLGDYASWSRDPRWDDYTYVGTIKTSRYDLEFLIRTSSKYSESLEDFLQRYVIDGRYDRFPYRIGSRIPSENVQPTWIPRIVAR